MAIVTLWPMEKSRTLPVFPGATKTRDPGPGIGLLMMLLYKKYLTISLHNLC